MLLKKRFTIHLKKKKLMLLFQIPNYYHSVIKLGWFFFQAILYMLPVGRVVEGQPLRTGGKLKYRCNGK
jgi:hypothetical protein